MKEAIQPQQQNQPQVSPTTIKAILPIAITCIVFGLGGIIAVFSQKPKGGDLAKKLTQSLEVKNEPHKSTLPPYTLLSDGEKVTVKFHSQQSDIVFFNLTNQQKICLSNGGGVGCVLPSYEAQNNTNEVPESPTQNHPRRAAASTSFPGKDDWLILGLAGGLAGYLLNSIRSKN